MTFYDTRAGTGWRNELASTAPVLYSITPLLLWR
jgi:hypothetical protein